MFGRQRGSAVVFCLGLIGAGCVRHPEIEGDLGGDVEGGVLELSIINVPTDVGCLQVLVSDGLRAVTRRIDVGSTGHVDTTQTGLPIDMVSIGVDAFAGTCVGVTAASSPTWTSAVVHTTLVSGMTVSLTVNMSRPGGASLGLNFPDAGTSVCGDGVLGLGEACDDGNAVNGDGCSALCLVESGYACPGAGLTCQHLAVCGNGVLEPSETCDDGNLVGGDGCSALCAVESGWVCPGSGTPCTMSNLCGNGILNPGEQCDLGAANNTGAYGGCTATCLRAASCGDGVKNGPEQCDLGAANNTGAYGGCTATCLLAASCGDGVKNGPEQCDLGAANNTGAYGGCTAVCQLAPYCGDGIKNGSEQCDLGAANGHGTTGAGCSTTCTGEYRLYREAESVSILDPLLIVSDATASGGAYIQVKDGLNTGNTVPTTSGFASYTFSVTTTGKYRVFGRFFTPSSSDDSFWVRLDSGPWTLWNNIFTRIGGTPWKWDEVHDSQAADAIVQYTITTTGSHTLQIGYREDGAKLDRIFITSDLTPGLAP
jgi:cysteine-rich repeat protein